ncbi:hypothetical protein IEO70_02755 [Bacillus sp. AGMB 02131]|uniref:Uncharacterized protein n=1 Tax=Peribacillus faecalis TaxID=2772559 RepID=A0A927HA82_9BACI|nr:hypothetical protein [Peribacillus faecalis]MBD3107272.1 hypothetical protein [Peribacillus faecalis]
MEKKKVIPTWVGIVNLILVLGSMAWTIYSMLYTEVQGHEIESMIIHALTLVLLFMALLYCVMGYKNKSNLFFDCVVYLYTGVVFVTSLLVREGPIFLLIISNLSFGILSILAIAKDIGKKKSFILCRINVLLALVRIIAYVAVVREFPGGMFGNFLLSIILGIMVYTKYTEKAK